MASSRDTSSAPGLALQTLLREAKLTPLRKLIGSSTVEVLEGLDPNLVARDRLGELASKLIDPSEALRNPEKRDQIISLLPLPKARELTKRLAVEAGKDLYGNLRRAASNNAVLPVLFSFFGVVRDVRAPSDTAPSATTTDAGYGLFDHQRIAAAKVARVLSDPPRKVVLHMPTGSGKTRTAMHIIASHLKNNEPTLVCWLAQNAELLDQAADEFEKAWSYLGNRPVDFLRFWGHRNPEIMAARDGLIVAGLPKMYAFDNRDAPELAVRARRDSGYRNTAYALAELIDNSAQAVASSVDVICLQETKLVNQRERRRMSAIAVLDNGEAMTPEVLRLALQFGNGTHLTDRSGIGRFGMGLPNSSISQCRRVEVWTWQNGPDNALYTYLDVDQIESRQLYSVPFPVAEPLPEEWRERSDIVDTTGTLVLWTNFDEHRLTWRGAPSLPA